MLTRFIRLVQFEFRRFKGRSKLGLIFILIIPLLYGGIYLHSNTDKVKIAIVNHDKPATFDGRTVEGGKEFQETLKKNPRFDWQFLGTDEDKAYQGLRDAEYFMVIEVPENFSTSIVSAGDFKPARATLKLHRDDANGFIIGLLTSQVQTALEQALDQSVSETYFNALFVNLGVIKDSLTKASEGSATLDSGMKTLDAGVNEMNTKVLGATKAVGDSTATVNKVNSALANADSAAAKTSMAVGQTRVGAQAITGAAQSVMADAQAVNSAMIPLINNVTKNLPALQKQAGNLVSATATLQNPNGNSVVKIQHDVTGAANKASALAAKHPELADDPDYIALTKQINGAASSTTTVSSNIAAVANISAGLNLSLNQQNADTLADNAKASLNRLNKDAQQVNNGLETINGAMDNADSAAKDLNKAVNNATDAGRDFTAKAPEIASGVMQLSNGLGQLKAGADALSKGATKLHQGLDTGAKQIPGMTDDQRTNLANVMSSPVDVEQTILHSAKYYGRGLHLDLPRRAYLLRSCHDWSGQRPVDRARRFRPAGGDRLGWCVHHGLRRLVDLGTRPGPSLVLHRFCDIDITVMDDAGLLDETHLRLATDSHLPHPPGAPAAHMWWNLPCHDAAAGLSEAGCRHADEVLRRRLPRPHLRWTDVDDGAWIRRRGWHPHHLDDHHLGPCPSPQAVPHA